jgi:LDH2 family malate/lactate/ureidoglycolate dehydrogenase
VTAPATFQPEQLVVDVARIFVAAGLPEADAQLVAHSLVTSEVWGHPSHGLLRVPWYLARIDAGLARPGVEPTVVSDAGAIAVLDGRDGVGQVVTDRAMDEAIRRAEDHGIGAVSVRDSNHFGTAAYYTRRAAERGFLAILATNSSPAMAPWGGREKVFGANPWSLAAPAGRYGSVVLDISNTAVARGKIYAARERGEEIPPTWATDAEGRATTDPAEAAAGLLMPMGGHKGYAISFMMDVLSGVLSGAASGRDVVGPQQATDRSRCGHFAAAIHLEALVGLDAFSARLEALIVQAHDTTRAEGVERILVPGELERLAEERVARDGLALAPRTVSALAEHARELGISATGFGT